MIKVKVILDIYVNFKMKFAYHTNVEKDEIVNCFISLFIQKSNYECSRSTRPYLVLLFFYCFIFVIAFLTSGNNKTILIAAVTICAVLVPAVLIGLGYYHRR